MKINILSLRNSINKAYLKVKPNRTQIETFKKNISNLFDQIKESESEEFHKNIVSEFLKHTYYSPNNYINTKGRADLVIHNGKDSNSTVGVLFELKKPSNKSEMPTCSNINTKGFQELVLYFLRERITHKNIEIKYLVVTNILEWFIFNANDFEKLFSSEKNFIKQFEDFENERLSGKTTDFFYKNIAEPFIFKLESEVSVTYFDIKDFETIIKNADKEDDNNLIALYKIFSPEHLLKLPFANDSNNLDKTFYNELLHIIGLEETKEGSKKLIGRKIEKKRNPGSLIENSITILKYEDCLSQLPKLPDFGNDREEQLFNISLELSITWINRILFLKLLEGQLIKYNNGDKSFRFLNIEKIHDFDELNKLFFQVLAVKESDRTELIKHNFGNIPYLNSSLFEPSDLEHKTIRINSLDDHSELPVLSGTVLKDKLGRKLTGNVDPLQYLFEFLDSYDFSSEGSEDIQEENKTLINASVLGLIFEKINGYKDGSFFTPGFITMYMCHETIRRTVVQKFNSVKGWKCTTISDVYNEIDDIKEANRIINSLRICDPAVGSGHFLVSALDEIIALKSELKILTDREGKKLKEYTIEVINDELIITDEQSKLFAYNPKSKESQRVQEALFQEKQRIIENCLFGVDINPNSVKICRLRLWIELLKNAYYKPDTNYKELETLPNIDINIKCGNSLISRYSLDAEIKTALKTSKWTIENYREAVMNYRNAGSKEEKRTLENLIYKIKNDFATEVSRTNQDVKTLNKYKNELLQLTSSQLFEYDDRKKKDWRKRLEILNLNIEKFELKITEIKNNKVFENAFEWRFEFPEVLNDDGDFVGFDVVIGNPPYIRQEEIKHFKSYFESVYSCYNSVSDLYTYFIELGINIISDGSSFSLILPNKFIKATYGKSIRQFILKNSIIVGIFDFDDYTVFEEATTYPSILSLKKGTSSDTSFYFSSINSSTATTDPIEKLKKTKINVDQDNLGQEWNFVPDANFSLLRKISLDSITLGELLDNKIFLGIKTGLNEAFIIDEELKIKLINEDPACDNFLKEVVLGKGIKKYTYQSKKKYLIFTDYDIEKEAIPTPIFSWLDSFKADLIKRGDQGKNWWNLRSCAYYDEIQSPKIIWTSITNGSNFYLDEIGQLLITNNNYFIANNSKALLGLLNSSLISFYLKNNCTTLSGGYYDFRRDKVMAIPVKPKILSDNNTKLNDLVTEIIAVKKGDPKADTLSQEEKIDRLVYEMYSLNEEEIQIVKSN
ncbi:MAG: Eco57I restriction-modification methylase domain-containing protein [Bacteroidales bacterium]